VNGTCLFHQQRLLELLTETEIRASHTLEAKRWTLVPRGVRGPTEIAMSWLPVRAKALELVRQRDALGSRVLFAQMSLLGSTVREQETRARKGEEASRERMDRLEVVVGELGGKLERLEDMVWRVMHRDRVGGPSRLRVGEGKREFDGRDWSAPQDEGENEETESESDDLEREHSPPSRIPLKPG
jgi:hypothetical protein